MAVRYLKPLLVEDSSFASSAIGQVNYSKPKIKNKALINLECVSRDYGM
jgi:hypothetical protein